MLYTGSPSSSPSPFHCHIWNLFVCSLHKQCFLIHWNSQETHFFTAQGSALRSNDTYICTSCTRITFTAKTPLWPIYKDVDLRNISSSSAGRIFVQEDYEHLVCSCLLLGSRWRSYGSGTLHTIATALPSASIVAQHVQPHTCNVAK